MSPAPRRIFKTQFGEGLPLHGTPMKHVSPNVRPIKRTLSVTLIYHPMPHGPTPFRLAVRQK